MHRHPKAGWMMVPMMVKYFCGPHCWFQCRPAADRWLFLEPALSWHRPQPIASAVRKSFWNLQRSRLPLHECNHKVTRSFAHQWAAQPCTNIQRLGVCDDLALSACQRGVCFSCPPPPGIGHSLYHRRHTGLSGTCNAPTSYGSARGQRVCVRLLAGPASCVLLRVNLSCSWPGLVSFRLSFSLRQVEHFQLLLAPSCLPPQPFSFCFGHTAPHNPQYLSQNSYIHLYTAKTLANTVSWSLQCLWGMAPRHIDLIKVPKRS